MMNNLEKYNRTFMEVFNVPESALDENFAYRSVKSWDSIAHMALISRLEDTFDILMDTDDILSLRSYVEGQQTLRKFDILIELHPDMERN